MTEQTPRQIVAELDRFIVGQKDAKKAVALALRNRWRRQQVAEPLRDEIMPKNILMIGPTGVGKTEIARRLAKLAQAPFIKVEATKFTEIGYVGRDVESIIRDLMEISVHMVKEEHRETNKAKAEAAAEERVIDALVGKTATPETREKFRTKLHNGELGDKEIEIEVADNGSSSVPSFDIPGIPGSQVGMINLGDMIGKAMGGQTKNRKMTVDDSYKILVTEEAEKLVDQEAATADALKRVEQGGIVFLDEVDKITSRSDSRGNADVNREGVQRDLLPLLEGTQVPTKYGTVKTDHILFIASGAFHMAKPSDLLPELQGRIPIRVELNPLTEDDMRRILSEPEASLIKQYTALMQVEDITLDFTDEGIQKMAELATLVNSEVENIGARRLHTLMEKLLEEISYDADEQKGTTLTINAAYVAERIESLAKNADLSKFIL